MDNIKSKGNTIKTEILTLFKTLIGFNMVNLTCPPDLHADTFDLYISLIKHYIKEASKELHGSKIETLLNSMPYVETTTWPSWDEVERLIKDYPVCFCGLNIGFNPLFLNFPKGHCLIGHMMIPGFSQEIHVYNEGIIITIDKDRFHLGLKNNDFFMVRQSYIV